MEAIGSIGVLEASSYTCMKLLISILSAAHFSIAKSITKTNFIPETHFTCAL